MTPKKTRPHHTYQPLAPTLEGFRSRKYGTKQSLVQKALKHLNKYKNFLKEYYDDSFKK